MKEVKKEFNWEEFGPLSVFIQFAIELIAFNELFREFEKRFPQRVRRKWQNSFYCPYVKNLLNGKGESFEGG